MRNSKFEIQRTIMGLAVFFAGLTGFAVADVPSGIVPHPEKLVYPKLEFKLPKPSEVRTTLSNGMVVYIAEDRMLPVFDLTITVRAGAAFDDPKKIGVAWLTGEQMRDGGTQDMTPEQLDERVEFLAARLFSSIGDTSGTIGVSCLSKDIDAGLELLGSMMRYPRFDETRFRLAKERRLQNIKRRNDATDAIERAEWGFLMYGEEHFANRYETAESLNAITRDDLVNYHRKYVHPGNMIVAVTGDFERKVMLEKLEKLFAGWSAGEAAPKKFEASEYKPKAGVYVVNKPDVNQGRVSVGHIGVMRGSPDEFALQVMNGILGASGFRSRIVARVRSDEGLAYNSGSRFGQGVWYPGDFRAWFQSKSNSCAYATKIVLEEIKRLRDEKVTEKDVEDTVNFYVESFPQRFQNKMSVLAAYVDDEYTGRDPMYWQTYIENLKKVTPDDVHRVAQKYLQPDQLVLLAVGDAEAICTGGYDKDAELKFESFGKIIKLPLRDPETMRR